MLTYLEFLTDYFNLPVTAIIVIVSFLLVANIIGEIMELKGKAVPEIMKIRKYFARKKKERETFAAMPAMMNNMKSLVEDFNGHYSEDNITKRNDWIASVNDRLSDNELVIKEINRKIDENSEAIIDLLLDNKRETIIAFAEKVCNENYPVTREQFHRILKIYSEYEKIIDERGLTNGEIDVAHKIIQEAYQQRLMNHTFIEDVRWHGLEG